MVNRRLDGNALQNSELLVSVLEMRKAFKEHVKSSDPDYVLEIRRMLPVETPEAFVELDQRLVDPAFWKQMVTTTNQLKRFKFSLKHFVTYLF